MKNQSQILAGLINKSHSIVFFGGAGVSTASGIPDFRSATGLYNRENKTNYSPETMLSYPFMLSHPQEFYTYKRKPPLSDAKPNLAHLALARLEAQSQTRPSSPRISMGCTRQRVKRSGIARQHAAFLLYEMWARHPAALVWEGKGVPHCPAARA